MLSGCAVGGVAAPSSETPNLTGNWAVLIPPAPVLLQGAMQSQGSQVTGTFSGPAILCGYSQFVSFAGSINSGGQLTLTSTPTPGNELQLAFSSGSSSSAVGTLQTTGILCALALSGPVTALEIDPLTGSYSGAVTATATIPASPIPSGTASLAVTQSASANSNGQFPVTGTLTFTGGGCTQTTALSGTVSGEALTLANSPLGPGLVTVTATTNPAASQLAATLSIAPSPCSSSLSGSVFAGTLTL